MTIGIPVRVFIIAYLFLLVCLVGVFMPVVAGMLLITYLREGTLEVPPPLDVDDSRAHHG